jgi:hypothetical protein
VAVTARGHVLCLMRHCTSPKIARQVGMPDAHEPSGDEPVGAAACANHEELAAIVPVGITLDIGRCALSPSEICWVIFDYEVVIFNKGTVLG